MKNKCLQCSYLMQVDFESGRQIKICSRFKIELDSDVISCSEFSQKGVYARNLEDWEMVQYLKSIEPYIIEERKKAGFINTEITIRPATNKDKKEL